MRTTKFRTMIAFVIALQVALVLAVGAAAASGPDKGGKKSDGSTLVQPGPHRGG
jgi:hypothetical protein